MLHGHTETCWFLGRSLSSTELNVFFFRFFFLYYLASPAWLSSLPVVVQHSRWIFCQVIVLTARLEHDVLPLFFTGCRSIEPQQKKNKIIKDAPSTRHRKKKKKKKMKILLWYHRTVIKSKTTVLFFLFLFLFDGMGEVNFHISSESHRWFSFQIWRSFFFDFWNSWYHSLV